MLAGSLFDCLVTTPELEKELFIQWTQSVPIPKGKVKDVVEAFHKALPEATLLMEHTEELFSILESMQYQTNWSREVRLNSVIVKSHGQAYLDHLFLLGDKKLVDAPTRIKVGGYANDLRAMYYELISKAQTQVPLYFTYEGIACKGLVDILVEEEDAISFYDLKFTELSLDDYYTEIRRRRSDLQLSFYGYGIEQLYGKPATGSLLVYSAVDRAASVITLSNVDMAIARYGAIKDTGKIHINNTTIENRIRIKGWEDFFYPNKLEGTVDSIWN